jgi:hypothetical protein
VLLNAHRFIQYFFYLCPTTKLGKSFFVWRSWAHFLWRLEQCIRLIVFFYCIHICYIDCHLWQVLCHNWWFYNRSKNDGAYFMLGFSVSMCLIIESNPGNSGNSSNISPSKFWQLIKMAPDSQPYFPQKLNNQFDTKLQCYVKRMCNDDDENLFILYFPLIKFNWKSNLFLFLTLYLVLFSILKNISFL